MAIPFNLPSDEETEENYRRLDQLLLDLYDVLRQILLRRRVQRAHRPEPHHQPAHHNHHQPAAHHNHHHQQTLGHRQQSCPRQGDLPDLVQSAGSGAPLARKPPVPPPRRRRRRGAEGKQEHHHGAVTNNGDSALTGLQQGPSWLNVGIELRQIAEEFRSTQLYDDGEEKTTSRKEIKASSLFSLLVPAPLTGSIWTTVIILVGWRILARHR